MFLDPVLDTLPKTLVWLPSPEDSALPWDVPVRVTQDVPHHIDPFHHGTSQPLEEACLLRACNL